MSPRRIAARLALAGLTVLPFLAVALCIQRYGGHLPLEDQWDTPGRMFQSQLQGTLHWKQFFVQHNEARKAFSSSAWMLLALNGWSVRVEMFTTALLAAVCVGLCYLLGRRALPGAPLAPAILAAGASVLLFSPIGFTGDPLPWLWGVNLENVIVVVALVGGVSANVLLRAWTPRYLIAIACALAATYSFANGMLLWVLLHPRWVLVRPRAERAATRPAPALDVLYLSVFALVVGTYFYGYFKPPSFPPFSVALQRPDQVALFYLAWIGGPLSPRPGSPELASAVGAVAVSLFAVGLVTILRRGLWARAYPFVVFGAYVLVSAGAVSLGRSTFGLVGALASRYYLHVLVFYLGLNGVLLLAWSARGEPRRGPLPRLALVLVALVQLGLVAHNWRVIFPRDLEHFHARNARGEAALRFVRLVPDNPDLQNLHEGMRRLVPRYHLLREAGVLKAEEIPGRQRMPVGDAALALGGPFTLRTGKDQVRLQGSLALGPAAQTFSHLVLEARAEVGNKYVSVLPLSIFPREAGGERRRVDTWIRTQNFPADAAELRLLGYDPHARRLVPLEPVLTLRPGRVKAADVLPVAGLELRRQAGVGDFDTVCDILPRGREEFPIPAGAPLEFVGWAIDPLGRSTARRAFVRAGGRLFPAQYHLPRPDVARNLGAPELLESGFFCILDEDLLGDDRGGPFRVVVETADGSFLESPTGLRLRRVERGGPREDSGGG